MTPWRRFARFNAVGALGVVVQLATIWALAGGVGVGYVTATLAGVGAALVHNFLWHTRWTWRDRPMDRAGTAAAFVRFVGANGVVSFIGNMAVMAALTGGAGLHPVPANAVAIAACGLVNFWLGNRVVFRAALLEIGATPGATRLAGRRALPAARAPHRPGPR